MPFNRFAIGLCFLAAGAASAQSPKESPPGPASAAALALEKFTLHHQPDIVWCVAFSPDAKTLASVSGLQHLKGELILWETATGKPKVRVQQALGIRFVAFSPDGTTLA